MLNSTSLGLAGIAFCAGLLVGGHDAPQEKAAKPKVHDTSEKAISKVRKSVTGSKWNLGSGDWQQFLSDMKTTNQLSRTGNWVVTDNRTLLTGSRGAQGAVYVWKLDKSLRKATIQKYVRDPKYRRSATRMP